MKALFLMCKPTYFDVTYKINPWMNTDVPVDKAKALTEWQTLQRTLIDAGAEISMIDPVEGLVDMVFSAEGGLPKGKKVVMSRMRNQERRAETPHYEQWFSQNGYEVFHLPEDVFFEGHGDSAWLGDKLILAYGIRSNKEATGYVAKFLGVEVIASLKLIDPYYYHLGACLSVLSDDLLIYYPPAFDDAGQEAVRNLPQEKIIVNKEDALTFVCNNARVGKNLIMAGCSQELEKTLNGHGFKIIRLDFTELKKSGGTAGCSVLALSE